MTHNDARIISLCGACREQDCECCDLLVWGGPCDCGCPTPTLTPRMPQPIVIALNTKRDKPVPPRRTATQQSHCQRGHPLRGDNVYRETGSPKRLCRTCRQASWRRYQDRRKARLQANGDLYKSRSRAYVAERVEDGTEDGLVRPSIFDE